MSGARQVKENANVQAMLRERGEGEEGERGSRRVFSGAFMSSDERKDAADARCRFQSGSQDPRVTTVYIQDK